MSILAFSNNNYKIVYINGLKCPEERAEGQQFPLEKF
jgi:hypothetical protein